MTHKFFFCLFYFHFLLLSLKNCLIFFYMMMRIGRWGRMKISEKMPTREKFLRNFLSLSSFFFSAQEKQKQHKKKKYKTKQSEGNNKMRLNWIYTQCFLLQLHEEAKGSETERWEKGRRKKLLLCHQNYDTFVMLLFFIPSTDRWGRTQRQERNFF